MTDLEPQTGSASHDPTATQPDETALPAETTDTSPLDTDAGPMHDEPEENEFENPDADTHDDAAVEDEADHMMFESDEAGSDDDAEGGMVMPEEPEIEGPQAGGKLMLVGVPAGHPYDITLRALRTLERADVVICTDYKAAARILRTHNIAKKLRSTEETDIEELSRVVTAALHKERTVALMSQDFTDTAEIYEPLLEAARELGVKLQVMPGTSQLAAALAVSGFNTDYYDVLGYLPRHPAERRRAAEELVDRTRTLVIRETPHRLRSLLEALSMAMPERAAALTINLSTPQEAVIHGTLAALFAKYSERRFKGDFILVLDAGSGSGMTADVEDFEEESEGFDEEIELDMAEVGEPAGWFKPSASRDDAEEITEDGAEEASEGGASMPHSFRRQEREEDKGGGWDPLRRKPQGGGHAGRGGGTGGPRRDDRPRRDGKPAGARQGGGRPGAAPRGDDRRSDGRFGNRGPDDRRSGDGRFGNRRPDDRRSGDGRFGPRRTEDRPSGDGRFGSRRPDDRRSGDGRFGNRRPDDRPSGDGRFGPRRTDDRRSGDGRFGPRRTEDRPSGDGRFGPRRSDDRRSGDGRFGPRRPDDRRPDDRRSGDRPFGDPRRSGGPKFGNARPGDDEGRREGAPYGGAKRPGGGGGGRRNDSFGGRSSGGGGGRGPRSGGGGGGRRFGSGGGPSRGKKR